MKILMLIHHLGIGGAERIFVDLSVALSNLGIEVIACSLSPGGPLLADLEKSGIRHVQLRKGALRFPVAFTLARLLRREGVDILHTHEFSASQWGRLATRLYRVPIVHTEHAVKGWIKPRKHGLVNFILGNHYAKIVCVSDAVRRSLEGIYPHDLLKIIPNGISTLRLTLSRSHGDLRAEYGIPTGHYVIGTVGRLSQEKGSDIFLKGLEILKRNRDDFVGMVVGGGVERESLEALARDLDLGPNLRFIGPVTNPQDFMGMFDAAVFASREESFGLAVVEQSWFSAPILATAVGGLPSLAEALPGIHLIPKEDPESIAERLGIWMDTKPVPVDASGIIRDKFSIERTAKDYIEVYRDCLA